ncbi:MAG: helix-turn-helix transcriptional regulator, partial [Pirellulaceae bacterium]
MTVKRTSDHGESRRSIACNGKLLAAERRARGWTQAELASKAGFTERLVGKAEAGKSISVQTLHAFAQTLSDFGDTVSSVDLSTDPVALAREFIHAMYHHGHEVIERTKHFIDPNVVFHFAGDPAVFPFAGQHVGIEAADKAFRCFFDVLEPPADKSEIHDYEFVATGRGALIWGETWIHPIGNPMTAPIKLAIRVDFRDGLMIQFDDRFDTQEGAKHF